MQECLKQNLFILKFLIIISMKLKRIKVFSHSYFTHLKIDMGQSAENQWLWLISQDEPSAWDSSHPRLLQHCGRMGESWRMEKKAVGFCPLDTTYVMHTVAHSSRVWTWRHKIKLSDNQREGLTLRTTYSPSLSCHELLVVLWVGVGLLNISFFPVCMPIGTASVQVLFT